LTGIRSGNLPVNEVRYKWIGALQPTSAIVVAKMYSASQSCRVVVSEKADLSSPVYSATGHARGDVNYIVRMQLSNLRPGTKYYYAISANGAIDNSSDDIGTFTTPEEDAFSYRFVVASCAVTSDHQVYHAMLNKSPLFYVSTGDLHYGNPNS